MVQPQGKFKRFAAFQVLVFAGGLSVNVPVPAVRAQDKSPDKHQSESQPSPDNTEKNLPTNHRNANRADQQSDEAGDRELTRKIRQSLVQDKSLSVYAHNVKIITRGEMVELKGPV